MAKEKRLEFIKEIERTRNSRLICLVLGDRRSAEPNLNLQKIIEDDLIVYLYSLLEKIGHTEKIDIFLYSRGGNTDVPSRVINLLRKYSNELGVIIPYRAHSAATMISIGCDEILMNEISELGPVDPSITGPFNPTNPLNAGQRLPVETEAILSFRDSMRKDFWLWLRPAKIATLLIQHINPIIIGSSHRARSLSKAVIVDFLKNHIKGFLSYIKIRRTASFLLRSDSHSYAIDINEAKSLGLKTLQLKDNLKKTVWELYKEYESDLKLEDIFNPVSFLGSQTSITEEFQKAVFESSDITYIFQAKIFLTKNPQTINGVNWITDENWKVS